MLRKTVILLMFLALSVCVTSVFGAVPPFRARRPLRVAMYPFVPDKAALFAQIKQAFESAYPEVELQIIDLTDNYYDESSPHAITNTDADVYEIDSVFLDDLVNSKRIQPLPDGLMPRADSFLPATDSVVRVGAATYAVPHWVCTNYLFTNTSDSLSRVQTFTDVTKAFSSPHTPGQGLLIDMKGRSTLGELYLNAILDRDQTIEKAAAHLTPATFDDAIGQVLVTVRALCDNDLCRDSDYHNMEGFYARRFTHHGGRAYVGYSESLHYVLEESITNCKKGECVSADAIAVRQLPLSDLTPQPFAWVDSFTLSSACIDQCLLDAAAFISYTTDPNQVRATLLPAYGAVPRYLLPALSGLYSDREVLAAVPQYAAFYPAIQHAVAVRGVALNQNLREIGKKLDKTVLGK